MILVLVATLNNKDQDSVPEDTDIIFKYQHAVSKDYKGVDEIVEFSGVCSWVVHDGYWNPNASTYILFW